jgi:hypothetical protein
LIANGAIASCVDDIIHGGILHRNIDEFITISLLLLAATAEDAATQTDQR